MCANRLDNIQRGDPITFTVNGSPVTAYPGESVATALLTSGRRIFRRAPLNGEGRGFFCGMGVCFDCLVTVDGVPNVRSCMIEVRPGCRVEVAEA
jgi:aerobic-type carbon monoxide dehydrogenase small subunit (CoxS/CutS family)